MRLSNRSQFGNNTSGFEYKRVVTTFCSRRRRSFPNWERCTRPARAMLLVPVLVAACAPPSPATTRATTDPARELLKVALAHALIDPGDLPDKKLIDTGTEILVRSTIPNSTAVIAPETLTAIPGKTFTLLAADELQARVTAEQPVYFVQVDGLRVAGDEAEMWIGVGTAVPPGTASMCCCVAKVRYTRVSGVWTYRDSPERVCA